MKKNDLSFIFANIIKFGLPFGISLALFRLFYFYFFSEGSMGWDVIGTSVALIVFGMIWGVVLALIRLRK